MVHPAIQSTTRAAHLRRLAPPISTSPPASEIATLTWSRLLRISRASINGPGAWQLALLLLIAFSVWLRLVDLGTIPGVNGDEAWYGVQMLKLEAGESIDWRTPTGNLMGPLQAAMLFFLQLFFPPSFVLLRIPSAVSGVAQILLAYLVVRKHVNSHAAWIAATLTAVLPANIAYSRFGWDVSHSGLAAWIGLHFALSASIPGTVLAFVLMLWVHPTNILAAPFLLLTFAAAELLHRRTRDAFVRSGALAFLLVVGGLAVLKLTTATSAARLHSEEILERAVSLPELITFSLLFARFLVGDVSYEYIAGKWMGPVTTLCTILILVTGVLLLVVGLTRRLPRRVQCYTRGIILGSLTSYVVFAIVIGSAGITPHTERYGYCLLVPAIAALAVSVSALTPRLWLRYVITLVAAVLLLTGFHKSYFLTIERASATAHRTFWTDDQEPKAVAANFLSKEARSREAITVLAEDWWLYWPLEYLLHDEPEITVVLYDPVAPLPSVARLYLVGFADGDLDRWTKTLPAACVSESATVSVYGRPRGLIVWTLPASESCQARLEQTRTVPHT